MKNLFKAVIVMLFAVSFVKAQVPQQISFSGRLTDLNRNVLDGTFSIVFSIYDASSGGTLLWTETQPSVNVLNGAVQTKLGSVTPIPYSVGNAASAYLQVQVGSDVLSPRQPLLSALYAYSANNLGGIPFTAYVDTITVQSIGGTKTFTSTVTAPGFIGSGFSLNHLQTTNLDAGALPGNVVASSFTSVISVSSAVVTSNVVTSGLSASGAVLVGSGASISTITASGFYGSGAFLTGITASSVAAVGVTSGTLAGDVIASSIAATVIFPDVQLTSNVGLLASTQTVTAHKTFTSSVTVTTDFNADNVSATRFFGSGFNLTGVTASSVAAVGVTSGTLPGDVIVSSIAATVIFPDVQLTSNVSLLNSTQTASANKTFTSTVTVNAFYNGGDSYIGSGILIATVSKGNLDVPGVVKAGSFFGDGTTLTGIVTSPMNSTLVFNSTTAIRSNTQSGVFIATHVYLDGKLNLGNGNQFDSSQLVLRSHYDSDTSGSIVNTPYDFYLQQIMDDDNPVTSHMVIRDDNGEDRLVLRNTGDLEISSGASTTIFSMGNLTVPGTISAADFSGNGAGLSGIVTNPMSPTLVLNSTASLRTNTRAEVTIETHTIVNSRVVTSNGSFKDSPYLGVRGSWRSGGNTHLVDYRFQAISEAATSDSHLEVTDPDSNLLLTILDSNRGGNVGIGVASPAAQLHISSGSAATADKLLEISSGAIGATQVMMRVMGDGNVVIGTATPNTGNNVRLQVTGRLRLVDGTQGNLKILQSDANGMTSWVTPTGVQLASTQTFTGQVTFYNGVTAASSTLTGNLGVGGNAAVTGGLYVGTGLTISTVTNIGIDVGSATVGALSVTGSASFPAAGIADAALSANVGLRASTQTFTGQNTFYNGLTASSATLAGDLSVGGLSSLVGNLYVGSGLTISTITSIGVDVGSVTAGALVVTSSVSLPPSSVQDGALTANVVLRTGDQALAGLKTFTSPLTVTSSMTVTGMTGIGGSITIGCKTGADLVALVPTTLGEVYCNSTDGYQWYVATGTVNTGDFAAMGRPTVGPLP